MSSVDLKKKLKKKEEDPLAELKAASDKMAELEETKPQPIQLSDIGKRPIVATEPEQEFPADGDKMVDEFPIVDDTEPEAETEELFTEEPKDTPKTDSPKTTVYVLPTSEEAELLNARIDSRLKQLDKFELPGKTANDVRQKLVDDLKKVREDKEKSLMMGQLAERFLAAVTKYAAAREGIDRGLDMSKVEIERTNWDKMIDRAQAKYAEGAKELISKFDKEDKAVSDAQARKDRLTGELADWRTRMARIEDARAAEVRRMNQLKEERVAKAKQNLLDRESRERIAQQKALSDSKKQEAYAVASKFSKDPKTVNILQVAYQFGPEAFDEVVNTKSVMKNLDPVTAAAYKKDPGIVRSFFGAKPELDVEEMYEAVGEEIAQTSKPEQQPPQDNEAPRAVRQVEYRGKLYNVYADGSMTEVK